MRSDDLDMKHLTVARLRDLLEYLPDDFRVTPNMVHNLAIYDKASDDGPKYLGFIDFAYDGFLDFGPR